MKSISSFSTLNKKPVLMISHEGLEAIKHIVRIAPQEAQWFHLIEPIYFDDSSQVILNLSTKLYIPKQNTSLAQVDSSSSMMIDFYHELKEEYSDQAAINSVLNSMTCWCHSHHNMSPSPSGQDVSQFNSFVKSSKDQNQDTWQVMLIFNKNDSFYSRVYDPETGLIYEGVDIIVNSFYDYSYIDLAAKEKFIYPKPKVKKTLASLSAPYSLADREESYLADLFFQQKEDSASLNHSIAQDLTLEIYSEVYTPDMKFSFSASNSKIKTLLKSFNKVLTDKELVWLSFILDNNLNKISKIFTDLQAESYFKRYSSKVNSIITDYITNTEDTLVDFSQKLSLLLSFDDCPSSQHCEKLLLTL